MIISFFKPVNSNIEDVSSIIIFPFLEVLNHGGKAGEEEEVTQRIHL
jgi:hypothetical protein